MTGPSPWIDPPPLMPGDDGYVSPDAPAEPDWLREPAQAQDGPEPRPIRLVSRKANGGAPERPAVPTAQGIDAVDLLALDLPPLRMVIPDLVPEGTTILASPPKVGKSCLVYQMAAEVALGGDLFGRAVQPGSVLYLALEDGPRRGQARLRTALEGRPIPRGRLEVRWSATRIGEGLEDEIGGWLDAHPDAALVAVDTLGRVRPRSSGHRGAYEVDVEDLARLQDLFRDRPVALVIVHHSRKQASDDFLATVSGTYGITGSADTILVVKRKRGDEFGLIDVTGRDIPEAEIPVRFNGWTWQEAPEAIATGSFEQTQVYSVIEKDGPIFPAAIAKQTGQLREAVARTVAGLVERGAVKRVEQGYVTTGGSMGGYSSYSGRDLSAVTPVTAEEEETSLNGYSSYSGVTAVTPDTPPTQPDDDYPPSALDGLFGDDESRRADALEDTQTTATRRTSAQEEN